MLNLLYDVSTLGIAYRNRSTFGLSRTTESLLMSLLAMSDVKVFASSDVSYNVWLFSKLYLKHAQLEEQLPWLSDSFNATIRDKMRQWFLRDALFNNYIEKLKKMGILKNETRVYQWRTNLLETHFRGTPRHHLSNIDVYHSTYHAIPDVIQHHKRVKAVLTVHDIIPILHPEWCGMLGTGEQKYFHPEFNLPAVLAKLTPKNWIICPSHSARNDLCEYLKGRIDADKVQVIPWAASPLFHPCTNTDKLATIRLKYKIPEGHYILSLCTIEPRKNIDTLIRSFYRLLQQEQINDLYLVLAGPLGWDYKGIFQEVLKNKQYARRIIFTGYIADEDIAMLYSNALTFVFPSLYEGFGLPPLEAMQCATPVICSNNSSLPEVIGEAGLLVNPRDEEAIAQAILELYCNAELRADLAQKGLNRSKLFSWQHCAKQTLEFYQK
ncbi:glycosyltransferase [Beggiatoa alba B18LD]|uniref:Glycosyltransferase n=1 Tax=Beggiatoa alba B18LD TaxID=395493 RepID=I3CI88_9GAMM|nr:glycosyltransferase family 1 protein [Beggiatoa alba]EIJ43331.1 glycosyltransferase [Beggiatoa alba B18LD]